MIPRRDWLAEVSYPEEIEKLTRQILNQNRKYFNLLVRSAGSFELWKKIKDENLVGLSL